MVRIREFIIFEPGKYILSSSAQARVEIDSQRLKYTFPSPTHIVPVTWNSGVFQGSLGPVDNALYIIPSQASLKAMSILYWWHQWCLQDLRCSADKNFKSKELSKSIKPDRTLNIQTPIFLGTNRKCHTQSLGMNLGLLWWSPLLSLLTKKTDLQTICHADMYF